MPQDLQKRTAIVELFKSGKTSPDIAKTLNINRMLVWRSLKWFKSTGDIVNQPGQGRPHSARTPKLVKSTREKLRRNPRRSLRNFAKKGKVPIGTMSTILHTDLQTSAYKHKKKQLSSESSIEKRAQRGELILSRITASMLLNLIFSDKKKFNVQQHVNIQNDRIWLRKSEVEFWVVTLRQGAASVMVWATVTETGRSLLVFVDDGIKLNQENYRTSILESALLPWAQKHFKNRRWSFQQDSASAHGAKKTQEWMTENVPAFIAKEESPQSSPDLNPVDFAVWSILESKVSATHHTSLDALKKKLTKEWEKIPKRVIRDSCKAFSKRFQQVVDVNGGYIE